MRSRGLIAGLALLVFVAAPGRSCGPYMLEMTFVNPHRPDNLKDFVEGRVFVVQPTFYVRSLALSYRAFNGPALNPAEKKSLLATYAVEGELPGPTHPGLQAWNKAYEAFLGQNEPQSPPITDAKVPGSQWQSYTNCYDDAFATAARTLASRGKQHPEAHLAVVEWTHGQDAVFSNCGAPHNLPAALPAGAPQWLQQDRTYQLAAAHLYRNEWTEAQAGFAAIAADTSSPWHDLAAYLVGRTLIRRATLANHPGGDMDGYTYFDVPLMTEAEAQMQRVAVSRTAYSDAASEMLNFVEFRLHSGRAIARVGDAISHRDAHLGQHLLDLRLGFDAGWEKEPERADAVKSDLIDWILTMQSVKPAHYAVTRWRATHKLAWLVAAMVVRQTGDALEPDLLAAALEIPEDSAAWPTVTVARLAHTPLSAETWQQLLHAREVLIAEHALPSAINQVTALAIQQAPSVDDFVRLAPMDPAGIRLDEVDFTALEPPGKPVSSIDEVRQPVVRMAGLPANVLGVKRFDDATAKLLNRRLPTSVLAPMVVDSNWPKQLRFEAAMAVWSRAVLLDQPEDARKLTPILIDGEPAWAPFLSAYDDAATPEARHLAGLLALMRYPSVRPFVNAGATRDDGFSSYSSYRDNWWCAKLDDQRMPYWNSDLAPPISKLPPFVTVSMTEKAQQEDARLLKLGDAPQYFGTQALAWVKAHPGDPHNAELLRFTDRAMRNGCNLEQSYALRQQLRARLSGQKPKP